MNESILKKCLSAGKSVPDARAGPVPDKDVVMATAENPTTYVKQDRVHLIIRIDLSGTQKKLPPKDNVGERVHGVIPRV